MGASVGAAGTGTPQVGVEFEFTEGPNQGKRLTWYGYLTDAAFDRTIEALRAAGWKGDMLDDLASLSAVDVPTVQLVVEEEEYDGKRRAKIAFVNRLGGLAMKNQFNPDDAKSFAEKMKARVQAADRKQSAGVRAPSTPKPQTARPVTQATPADDKIDIPF